MNYKTILFRAGVSVAVLALAVALLPHGEHSQVPVRLQWQLMIANARTLVAGIEYLCRP